MVDSEVITTGSVNVYECLFRFSEGWDGYTKTAVFRYREQTFEVLLDENNMCTIPWEVLDIAVNDAPIYSSYLMVGVCGVKGNSVLPTIWVNAGTIFRGAEIDTDTENLPTPSLVEQALAALGKAVDGIRIENGHVLLMSGNTVIATANLPENTAFRIEEVDALPPFGEPSVIYMVPQPDVIEDSDQKVEYVWLPKQGRFEKIGTYILSDEGGVGDHNKLINKNDGIQHEMSSIGGLEDTLSHLEETIPSPTEPITNLELEELLK